MSNPWLEDRRWRWRVIVTLIVLGTVFGLLLNGRDLFGAITAVFLLFWVIAQILDMIINKSTDPRPSTPAKVINAISAFSGQHANTPAPDNSDPNSPSAPEDPSSTNAKAA